MEQSPDNTCQDIALLEQYHQKAMLNQHTKLTFLHCFENYKNYKNKKQSRDVLPGINGYIFNI